MQAPNSSHSRELNKTQLAIGLGMILLILVLSYQLNLTSNSIPLYLITGIGIGYVLNRSNIGFSNSLRFFFIDGDGALVKAILILFAVSLIGAAGVHWGAASTGAVPLYRLDGAESIIPGTESVQEVSIATMLGAFLFGGGMVVSGGCSSGTLVDLGKGKLHALIALVFLVIGTVPGYIAKNRLDQTTVGSGIRVYFPDHIGYAGSVALSLLLLLGLYAIVKKYENNRKRAGTYTNEKHPNNTLTDAEEKHFYIFSRENYEKGLVKNWSLITGSLLLAFLFIFILNSTGSSWRVTVPYTRWGVGLMQIFGVEFDSPVFSRIVLAVRAGLQYDNQSMRNVGMILGSALAFLLAGKFKLDLSVSPKDAAFYTVGGFLMGFGARLAGGCNIGALYSGICNFSLSGWSFLVFALLGGTMALKLFAGKVRTIPSKKG